MINGIHPKNDFGILYQELFENECMTDARYKNIFRHQTTKLKWPSKSRHSIQQFTQ